MQDAVVAISKSWRLFYLLALSAGVVIYAYWASNRAG
ncbi:cbb3-type cytochrome c oxidase subunit 3, partial [Mesorhizobium sp. M1D.F.Ca.ET.183.01.1.1]